jgi:hypothetical protein
MHERRSAIEMMERGDPAGGGRAGPSAKAEGVTGCLPQVKE